MDAFQRMVKASATRLHLEGRVFFAWIMCRMVFKVIHAGESGLPSSAIQHAGRSLGDLEKCFKAVQDASQDASSHRTTTGARMIDREWEKLSAQCSCRSSACVAV